MEIKLLLVGVEQWLNGLNLVMGANVGGQVSGVVFGTIGGVHGGHGDTPDVLAAACVGRHGGYQCGVDTS